MIGEDTGIDIMDEVNKLEPWDVITIKGGHNEPNKDVLVKRVSDIGVFVLERVQSTAVLVSFEDIIFH